MSQTCSIGLHPAIRQAMCFTSFCLRHSGIDHKNGNTTGTTMLFPLFMTCESTVYNYQICFTQMMLDNCSVMDDTSQEYSTHFRISTHSTLDSNPDLDLPSWHDPTQYSQSVPVSSYCRESLHKVEVRHSQSF